jgi:hypothetical protein
MYAQAIRTMEHLPQPTYVAYRLESTSDGLEIGLRADEQRQVWLTNRGGSTPQAWELRHRTFDYETAIVDNADGKRYLTARSFFDPTWYGAVRALGQGMFNSQDPAPPRDADATSIAPATAVIGTVAVMGPSIYTVRDVGPASCPDDTPGRAMHLTPRTAKPQYQLTDVVVATASLRFCMMRFSAAGAASNIVAGIYEQHYAEIDGYWIVTDGLLSGSWPGRLFERPHGTWRFRYRDVSFPPSIPDAIFAQSTS